MSTSSTWELLEEFYVRGKIVVFLTRRYFQPHLEPSSAKFLRYRRQRKHQRRTAAVPTDVPAKRGKVRTFLDKLADRVQYYSTQKPRRLSKISFKYKPPKFDLAKVMDNLHCAHLLEQLLSLGADDVGVFGNLTAADLDAFPEIVPRQKKALLGEIAKRRRQLELRARQFESRVRLRKLQVTGQIPDDEAEAQLQLLDVDESTEAGAAGTDADGADRPGTRDSMPSTPSERATSTPSRAGFSRGLHWLRGRTPPTADSATTRTGSKGSTRSGLSEELPPPRRRSQLLTHDEYREVRRKELELALDEHGHYREVLSLELVSDDDDDDDDDGFREQDLAGQFLEMGVGAPALSLGVDSRELGQLVQSPIRLTLGPWKPVTGADLGPAEAQEQKGDDDDDDDEALRHAQARAAAAGTPPGSQRARKAETRMARGMHSPLIRAIVEHRPYEARALLRQIRTPTASARPGKVALFNSAQQVNTQGNAVGVGSLPGTPSSGPGPGAGAGAGGVAVAVQEWGFGDAMPMSAAADGSRVQTAPGVPRTSSALSRPATSLRGGDSSCSSRGGSRWREPAQEHEDQLLLAASAAAQRGATLLVRDIIRACSNPGLAVRCFKRALLTAITTDQAETLAQLAGDPATPGEPEAFTEALVLAARTAHLPAIDVLLAHASERAVGTALIAAARADEGVSVKRLLKVVSEAQLERACAVLPQECELRDDVELRLALLSEENRQAQEAADLRALDRARGIVRRRVGHDDDDDDDDDDDGDAEAAEYARVLAEAAAEEEREREEQARLEAEHQKAEAKRLRHWGRIHRGEGDLESEDSQAESVEESPSVAAVDAGDEGSMRVFFATMSVLRLLEDLDGDRMHEKVFYDLTARSCHLTFAACQLAHFGRANAFFASRTRHAAAQAQLAGLVELQRKGHHVLLPRENQQIIFELRRPRQGHFADGDFFVFDMRLEFNDLWQTLQSRRLVELFRRVRQGAYLMCVFPEAATAPEVGFLHGWREQHRRHVPLEGGADPLAVVYRKELPKHTVGDWEHEGLRAEAEALALAAAAEEAARAERLEQRLKQQQRDRARARDAAAGRKARRYDDEESDLESEDELTNRLNDWELVAMTPPPRVRKDKRDQRGQQQNLQAGAALAQQLAMEMADKGIVASTPDVDRRMSDRSKLMEFARGDREAVHMNVRAKMPDPDVFRRRVEEELDGLRAGLVPGYTPRSEHASDNEEDQAAEADRRKRSRVAGMMAKIRGTNPAAADGAEAGGAKKGATKKKKTKKKKKNTSKGKKVVVVGSLPM